MTRVILIHITKVFFNNLIDSTRAKYLFDCLCKKNIVCMKIYLDKIKFRSGLLRSSQQPG